MTGVLYGLARFCVRRRFVVLGVWLVVTVALVAVSHRLGDNTNDNLSLPGTDSQQRHRHAREVLPRPGQRDEPDRAARAQRQADRPQVRERGQPGGRRRRQGPERRLGRQPAHPQGASALSKDQATGYLSVTLAVSPGELSVGEAQTIIDAAQTRRRRPALRWRPAASSARRCPSPRPSPAS